MTEFDYTHPHKNGTWDISWRFQDGKFSWFFNDQFGALPNHEEVEIALDAVKKYMANITSEEILKRNEWAECRWYIMNMGSRLPIKYSNLEEFKASSDYKGYLRMCQPTAYAQLYPAKPKAPPIPGYIYLIKAETGPYKIGRSTQVGKRFSLFSVKLPFKIELIHSFPSKDYVAAEKKLHEQFKLQRLEGEWFDLSPADVLSIKQISTL